MSDKRISRVRNALVYVLPGIAILGLTTVAATRPVSSSGSDAMEYASNWVTANRDALPTTLDTIASLPFAHRRLIMAELSVEQQKRIWREQLEAFITPDDDRTALQKQIVRGLSKPLTQEQRDFLRAEIDSLDGTFRKELTADERSQRAAAACARTNAMFDRADAKVIMIAIGGIDDTYLWATSSGAPAVRFKTASVAGVVTGALRAALTRVGAVPPRTDTCFCAQTYFCECSGARQCLQNWPVCEPPGICGYCCGCQGMQACDGSKCV